MSGENFDPNQRRYDIPIIQEDKNPLRRIAEKAKSFLVKRRPSDEDKPLSSLPKQPTIPEDRPPFIESEEMQTKFFDISELKQQLKDQGTPLPGNDSTK